MNPCDNSQVFRPSAAIVEAISAYESETASAQVSKGLRKRKKQEKLGERSDPVEYLTQAQVLEQFDVSRNTLRKMRQNDLLRCHQDTDGLQAWRYSIKDLETHLARRDERPAPTDNVPDVQWLRHRIEIEDMKAELAAEHAAELRQVLAIYERKWSKR